MKTWVRKSLNVGVLSAGFLLVTGVTASAAHADWTSGNNAGLLNGNQLDSEIQIPVDVSGNALALLGFADASSDGGAWAKSESASATESWTTGYNAGVLNGNQLKSTIQAPINICGNSIAVLGFSSASCDGGAVARSGESANATESSWTTGYNAGALNGNQASSTIQVPIDLCGNAISVFGFSSASCSGGAWAVSESGAAQENTTGFNAGIANGNQITSLIQVPVNVCGNAIAVFGFADASCDGGAGAVNGGGMGNGGSGSGNGGNGNGNGGYDDDDNGSGAGNGDDGYGGGQSNGGDGYGGGQSNGGDGYGGGQSNGGYSAGAASHGTTVKHHHKVSPTKKATGAKKAATKKAAGGVSPAGVTNLAADEHSRRHVASDPYAGGQSNGGNGNGGNGGNGNGNGGNGNGNGNGGGAGAGAGSCGDWTTGYNAGLLNGNQIDSTIQIPVNISGNALAVLGFASASSSGGAVAHSC